MGEGGRTPRSAINPDAAAVAVVVAAIGACAAAGVAAVIVVAGIAPGWSGADGLHGDLRSGLSCGVEGLRSGVVLGPELNRRLHGDLCLLGKAVAAVGWRGAAVARRRCVVRGRRGVIGRGRTEVAPIRPIQVCMRLDLDHAIGTWAEEKAEDKCQNMNHNNRKYDKII